MERKLPSLILSLLLGSFAAGAVGCLVAAGGVALTFGRYREVALDDRAKVLAQGISESVNLGALAGLACLPLGWWWAVRRWRRAP